MIPVRIQQTIPETSYIHKQIYKYLQIIDNPSSKIPIGKWSYIAVLAKATEYYYFC